MGIAEQRAVAQCRRPVVRAHLPVILRHLAGVEDDAVQRAVHLLHLVLDAIVRAPEADVAVAIERLVPIHRLQALIERPLRDALPAPLLRLQLRVRGVFEFHLNLIVVLTHDEQLSALSRVARLPLAVRQAARSQGF